MKFAATPELIEKRFSCQHTDLPASERYFSVFTCARASVWRGWIV